MHEEHDNKIEDELLSQEQFRDDDENDDEKVDFYQRSPLKFFETSLEVAIYGLLVIQLIVYFFFPKVKIESIGHDLQIVSIAIISNPLLVWIGVFMLGFFLTRVYYANKSGRWRFLWYGIAALILSGTIVFISFDSKRVEIWHKEETNYFQNDRFPSWLK